MHQITALFLAVSFLLFTGCEDKKPNKDTIAVENTTTVITRQGEEKSSEEGKEIVEPSIQTEEETIPDIEPQPLDTIDTLELHDVGQQTYTLNFKGKDFTIENHSKPIVLLQLFATWCAPCVGEIAYLNDLSETYNEDLFVAGILTRDPVTHNELNLFIDQHHINYKILRSQNDTILTSHFAQELNIQGILPLPFIILYVNGKYYTHYEGSVPVEMVKYDIKQAQQHIKN